MSDIQRKGTLFKIKVFQEFHKPRIFAGYLLGISQSAFLAWNYVRFSSGMDIQFMEPFLMLMNNWYSYTLVMLGYFIVIADAPFIDNLSQLVMVRAGSKRKWGQAMCLYMLFQAVFYLGLCALISFAVCIHGSCVSGNEWSKPLRVIMQVQPASAIQDYGFVFFSAKVLEIWRPYMAFFHCFCLTVLYLYSFALILFGLNLLSDFPVGSFGILLLHFVGVLVIKNEGEMPLFASLLAHGILEFHDGRQTGLTLEYSYVQFLVLCMVAGIGIWYLLKKCDCRVANSGRLW